MGALTVGSAVSIAPSGVSHFGDDATITRLPDGRLIALGLDSDGTAAGTYYRAYYSEDEGATWALYDADPFGKNGRWTISSAYSVLLDRMRWRADSAGEVLFVRTSNPGVQTLIQNAASLGSGFGDSISFDTTYQPTHIDACALAEGGFLVVGSRSGYGVYVWHLTHARDPIGDITPATVAAGVAATSCAV